MAWLGRAGMARLGKARLGMARQAGLGRQGGLWQG
nr:MAG TPA: hypothetical protein [Caudoviricetes sp.]